MSLLSLQMELESSASKRLRCSMNIATSTKLNSILRKHPDTLTSLLMEKAIADFGEILMITLPTRGVTAWLRPVCSTTVCTRETRSSMGVMHLLKDGKKKWQLRESNARSTTLVSKQTCSRKSRKCSTKDQAGARFTTMTTCTMNSSPITLMETLSATPATTITITSMPWTQL